jgi:hypothetical protein
MSVIPAELVAEFIDDGPEVGLLRLSRSKAHANSAYAQL